MLIHDRDGSCVKPCVKRPVQTLLLFQPECIHNTLAAEILCCITGSNVRADFMRGWDAVGTAQRVGAMKIKKLEHFYFHLPKKMCLYYISNSS